jgi:hypothetical protein
MTNTPDKLLAALDWFEKHVTDSDGGPELDIITAGIAELTARAEAAEARVAECEKEAASLRAFANEVMEDWPEGAPDGGALQDYATKHGLLREVTMAGPCGDTCGCSEFLGADDWPNECYRRTSLLTGKPETDAAIDALAGQPKDSQP